MPNVTVYHICVGKKDCYNNIGIIYRVEGFKNDVLAKAYSSQIGTLSIFFVLN